MSHRETQKKSCLILLLFRLLVGEIPHLGGGQITVFPAVRNGKDGRGNGESFFFSSLFLGGEGCGAAVRRHPDPSLLVSLRRRGFYCSRRRRSLPTQKLEGIKPFHLRPVHPVRREEEGTIWLLRRGGAHIKVGGGGGDGYWSHVPRSPLPLSTHMSRWSEQRRRMGKRVLCSPSPFS